MAPLPMLNIFEKMRGIYSPVVNIRRHVLSEVGRMVVEGKPPSYIEQIPYHIIPSSLPTYRESAFKERAIVRERVRLAFGMDLKEFGAQGPIHDEDVVLSLQPKKIITRPIVNVIKIGCERCPEDSYWVTNLCRGCIAHPCVTVCPKNAVSIVEGKSVIDQEKCILCGKCAQVCPYNAIAYRERPCAVACGVNAISSDADGFADIDYEKCVSCGLCIVSCPFGAIAEKSEIAQIISALKSEKSVYAEIAPAFVNQFGPLTTPEKIVASLKQMGFKGVREVAAGADKVVLNEAQELLELIEANKKGTPEKGERTFVGTSCCTAWTLAAQDHFPDLARLNISESFAPMVETARLIKTKDPEAVVVFIGPCIAKKEECFREEVIPFVDFVMTFEELAALFQSFLIDPTKIEADTDLGDASTLGRGFPVAGGVAAAVKAQTCQLLGEDCDIPTQAADTLKDCLSMLKNLSRGKYDPVPLICEGMACPFGCIGGPGTLSSLRRAKNASKKYSKKAPFQYPSDHASDLE
ncbi:MAG: monomeric [FeFe] hydrogenase [Promethearchaeota archaeon]